MKNIAKISFVFFILLITNVAASADIAFLDRVLLSNSEATLSLNPLLPGESVDVVRGNDQIIYYVANIGVMNPQKTKYNLEIICMDSKGQIVIRGIVKRSLSDFMYTLNGDLIRGVTQTLALDPTPGAMAKGQLIPLESGNDYFIKLYFEKKLIGLTKFHYLTK